MLRPTLLSAGLLLVTALSQPASAEILRFKADLIGAAQVPPVNTTAAGTASMTFDTATRTVGWTITFNGLSGPVTAAHFHGPAAPDKNASPVVVFGPTLTSPIVGSTVLTEPQSRDFNAGQWYVNIHTAAHPGGEIRGQATLIR